MLFSSFSENVRERRSIRLGLVLGRRIETLGMNATSTFTPMVCCLGLICKGLAQPV